MGSYSNLQRKISTIPNELRPYRQFVCWRYEAGKKPPVDPRTGKSFDWRDSSRWLSYESANAAAEEHGYDGIGFVCTPDDPFVFIDLDDVRDPKTGEIKPWAMEIVEWFDSYTEVSPSGTGLRITMRGKLPRVTKAGTKPKELFVSSGYVTITGNALPGYETIHERQQELEVFYETHIRCDMLVSEPSTPSPDPVNLSDAELLQKARNGALGSKFVSLFDMGDTSVYSGDESRADFDLMRLLAFWTQKDADRMERLFSDSALGRREKWRIRLDYRQKTVQAAILRTSKVYEPNRHRPQETTDRDQIRDSLVHALLSHPWKEKAGRVDTAATDFYVHTLMLERAWEANTTEVDISKRDCRDEVGLGSLDTASASLTRLQDTHRLWEKINNGDHEKAARYRLRTTLKSEHIQIDATTCVYKVCVPILGHTRLFRHPGPARNDIPVRGLLKVHGMAAAIAVAYNRLTGKPVSEKFLVDRLGVRLDKFRERYSEGVAGLLVKTERGFTEPNNVEQRLKDELIVSGALKKYERCKERTRKDRRVRDIKRLARAGQDAESIHHETDYDLDEIRVVLKAPDDMLTDLASEAHSEPSERIVGAEESSVVELPLVGSAEETYTPSVSIEEMVRNLPERDEDGIYDHGMICSCWMCDEDAPEYASVTSLNEYRKVRAA